MKKNMDSNQWYIEPDHRAIYGDTASAHVEINDTDYHVDQKTACIAHCLLLLTDAIRDLEL